jgi:anti-sigma regulatory factor (Ser/Thr protein kinase)
MGEGAGASVSVDGSEGEVAHFTAEGISAAAARRFVSATLAAWGFEALEDAATLLASELVANVVLHAGTDLDVVLRRPEGCVRIEVHDRDHRLPTRKHYSVTATTGRGLGLLEDLARSWGAEATSAGKVVWFELDETAAPFVPLISTDFSLDDLEDLFDVDAGSSSSRTDVPDDDPSRPGPAGAGRPPALSCRL